MKYQLVAVYGSLKRGYHNHIYLSESELIATDRIGGFDMFSLGSYPMVVEGTGEIDVEVYKVSPDTFARLDRLEGYPDFYDRTKVSVKVNNQERQAWLYIGDNEQVKGLRRVVDGNWQHNASKLAPV